MSWGGGKNPEAHRYARTHARTLCDGQGFTRKRIGTEGRAGTPPSVLFHSQLEFTSEPAMFRRSSKRRNSSRSVSKAQFYFITVRLYALNFRAQYCVRNWVMRTFPEVLHLNWSTLLDIVSCSNIRFGTYPGRAPCTWITCVFKYDFLWMTFTIN